MLIQHALLTRFNLPTPGHEGYIRAAPHWLENRFELFERYCTPSVLSQTCKNFRWIIYFDPQTPDWAKTKIEAYARGSVFHAIYREEVPKPVLLADIASVFGGPCEQLLTSSLDNDDMLARFFVERLQEAARGGSRARTIYNYPLGYTYAAGCLYRHRDLSNAFASMCEPSAGALTIWHDWHTRLRRYGPMVQLSAEPAWVQVIHGRNVSNRIRGWLVPADHAGAAFAFPTGELKSSRRSERMRDKLLYLFMRQPREAIRRLGRIAISAFLPKETLAAAKLWYSRVLLLSKRRP